MSVMTWTYLIVGLSFALYIGIAIWTRVGTTKEYYVAGGGISPVVNGMATGADWMSAASFIGMAGSLYALGYGGLAFILNGDGRVSPGPWGHAAAERDSARQFPVWAADRTSR